MNAWIWEQIKQTLNKTIVEKMKIYVSKFNSHHF